MLIKIKFRNLFKRDELLMIWEIFVINEFHSCLFEMEQGA